MEIIQLTDSDLMADADVDVLGGQHLSGLHYDRIIRDSATVRKPDGSPLLIYARDALPRTLCQRTFDALKSVKIPTTDNRGSAAGGGSFRRRRKDGVMSNIVRRRPIQSVAMGFLDRAPRNPYCRMTSFSRDHFDMFSEVRPLIRDVDRLFHQLAPERWLAQRQFVDTVCPDFVIGGTVFTSVTVNDSARTAAHKDQHDYRPGFGVMTVLEGGRFYGGELIFPKYRTAVDMRTGGICLADVHEWHGNAPMLGTRFKRLSLIFYAREHMDRCGTVEAERTRAAALFDNSFRSAG